MTTIIPAKDAGRVIYEDLLKFAIEKYGVDGEVLLANFLDNWTSQYQYVLVNSDGEEIHYV